MSITIPVWLLWTLGLAIGIPLVLAILFLAFIGATFLWAFKDGFLNW